MSNFATVFLATPVKRTVARTLLPSTKQLRTRARTSLDSLFMGIVMLERSCISKRVESKSGGRDCNPASARNALGAQIERQGQLTTGAIQMNRNGLPVVGHGPVLPLDRHAEDQGLATLTAGVSFHITVCLSGEASGLDDRVFLDTLWGSSDGPLLIVSPQPDASTERKSP